MAANKNRIKELSEILQFRVIANKEFNWRDIPTGSLDFLEFILEKEFEFRKQNTILRNIRLACLPKKHKNFDVKKLHEGVRYQTAQLEKCKWIEEDFNLFITGAVGTGKTALAVHLTNAALEQGFKAYYITMENLLAVLHNKETERARLLLSRVRKADILVLDEFLDVKTNNQEITPMYRFLNSLRDSTSIVFISIRSIQECFEASEDNSEMLNLLMTRAFSKAEVIKLPDKPLIQNLKTLASKT